MRRGVWHQCGDRSQKVVLEFLRASTGVGVIISPKDLTYDNATDYAARYRDENAGVLLDPQFYEPEYSAGRLGTYPLVNFRRSIATLGALPTTEMTGFMNALEAENRSLQTEAVIAPAVPYEAARPDIIDLNARLFSAAKSVGDAIGVPTYATVVLGQSSTTSDVAHTILSSATALDADGWYYGFEFAQERLPTDVEAIYRYCSAGLTLACSGKPVLHACAGPLALISFGSGARAAGIAFWQNLWGFNRARWQPPAGQGGGGDAPPRFFSSALWGTIIYPDEIAQLTQPLQAQIMVHSPYSGPTAAASGLPWKKWDAYKHLVHVNAATIKPLADLRDARQAMSSAVALLNAANGLHSTIRNAGLRLKDNTDGYQAAWAAAGTRMLTDNSDDYDYLAMIGGP
jgi:hypothetical protein